MLDRLDSIGTIRSQPVTYLGHAALSIFFVGILDILLPVMWVAS